MRTKLQTIIFSTGAIEVKCTKWFKCTAQAARLICINYIEKQSNESKAIKFKGPRNMKAKLRKIIIINDSVCVCSCRVVERNKTHLIVKVTSLTPKHLFNFYVLLIVYTYN